MLIKNFFPVRNKKLFFRNNKLTLKHSISDFFELDIHSIPDAGFHKSELRLNSRGEIVQKYRKKLNYRECGIFDIVEVLIIDNSAKQIIFKSSCQDKVKMKDLKNLIDGLFFLYGDDCEGRGEFSDISLNKINHETLSEICERKWIDNSKFQYPVIIRRNENELAIVISGIE